MVILEIAEDHGGTLTLENRSELRMRGAVETVAMSIGTHTKSADDRWYAFDPQKCFNDSVATW